jgi:membrane protease subunit (stomatin/prohibitin family)
MRRRGPGVVGTMARTAVVAGTATAVSGRVARRQASKYQQQQAAQAPPEAPPAPADDTTAQLQQLAELHAQGILTDEEFAAKKAQILGI